MSSTIYDPNLYDIFSPTSINGDIEWYKAKAQQFGEPILELGAGTGRIAIPLIQDGHSVFALDNNSKMLNKLREKISTLSPKAQNQINIIKSDMRYFNMGQEFPLIIIPFRAFLHNLTYDDQISCLKRVHAHLKPDGCLSFNVFHPSLYYMAQHTGQLEGVWRWTQTATISDGGSIVRSEANRYNSINKCVHSLHRYDQYNSEGELTQTVLKQLELAYLYPDDIRHLLEKTGFKDIRIHGDFNGRPLQNDTDEMVIEARRS